MRVPRPFPLLASCQSKMLCPRATVVALENCLARYTTFYYPVSCDGCSQVLMKREVDDASLSRPE
jgi:hypothetical protein